jgi:hypothetical protein
LCLHYSTCLFGHIRKDNRKNLTDFLFLFVCEWSSSIAFYTAATTAFVQVAAEVLLQDI